MPTKSERLRWTQKIVDQVLLLEKLKKITRAKVSVDVYSPAKPCQRCKRRHQVLVSPGLLCSTCWSKAVIRDWDAQQ